MQEREYVYISQTDPRWIPIAEKKDVGGAWYLILFDDGHIEENTAYRLADRQVTHYMIHPEYKP